jgi:hypothetical protein
MWFVNHTDFQYMHVYYPLANEVARGYSNATVCPSVRPSQSLW